MEGSIEMVCDICGKIYRRAISHANFITKTCSLKCRGIATRTEFPSAKDVPAVRKWLLRRGMIKVCQHCGFDSVEEILIVHHKDRDRTNNGLDNLIVLCPNCHSIEHYVENRDGWKHKSTKRKLRLVGGEYAITQG